MALVLHYEKEQGERFFPFLFNCIVNCTLQYGRIAHIDLKVPPRPPGYAFVEVCPELSEFFMCILYVIYVLLTSVCYSLRMLEMLKMRYVVAMAMTLMGIVCGLATFYFVFLFMLLMHGRCVNVNFYLFLIVSLYLMLPTVILQVELAHGGRGHSSSTDRYSSHGGGRGGRGVSRRSDYRGL